MPRSAEWVLEEIRDAFYSAFGFSSAGVAPSNNGVRVAPLVKLGAHNSQSVTGTAAPLSVAPPAGTTKVIMQATVADIVYTIGGTTPTASLGFYLVANSVPVIIDLPAGNSVNVIRAGSTNATLQYQYVSN